MSESTSTTLSALPEGVPRLLDPRELSELLAAAESLREEDTSVQGTIRLLRVGDALLATEQDARGAVYVRRLVDLPTAERFLGERLATYDRMWDGCGCRVDPSRRWPEQSPG